MRASVGEQQSWLLSNNFHIWRLFGWNPFVHSVRAVKGAMIPAAFQGVGLLPHHSWDLFLMASSSSPISVPKWVSFEQLSLRF
jgi:hypothetical protein